MSRPVNERQCADRPIAIRFEEQPRVGTDDQHDAGFLLAEPELMLNGRGELVFAATVKTPPRTWVSVRLRVRSDQADVETLSTMRREDDRVWLTVRPSGSAGEVIATLETDGRVRHALKTQWHD